MVFGVALVEEEAITIASVTTIVIILMEEAMLTVVAEATLEATMVAVVKADAEGKIKEVEAMVEEDNNIRISFLSSSNIARFDSNSQFIKCNNNQVLYQVVVVIITWIIVLINMGSIITMMETNGATITNNVDPLLLNPESFIAMEFIALDDVRSPSHSHSHTTGDLCDPHR